MNDNTDTRPTGKPVKAADIEWETFEGMTQGFVDVDGETYEINISARVPRNLKWGERGTNERAWTAEIYGVGEWFAEGDAEGLRASKMAAIAALNAYLKR